MEGLNIMEKEFYSIRELQTIYQIVRTEEFPKIMIGKKIYIPINEFNEWKKKHIGAKV